MATKGRWAVMMQTAIAAKVRQEGALRTPRARHTSSTTRQNKVALAKALANIPASSAPRASNSKSVPSNTAANKARLAAVLADD